MVAWWWLIIAFIAGDLMGVTAMAICSGLFDRMVEKKTRQRCSADGSEKGVQSNEIP